LAFARSGRRVAFALGDGSLRLCDVGPTPTPETLALGDCAILRLEPDFDDDGFLLGLDDGRLARIDAGGSVHVLATRSGRWIDPVSSHPSGFRAFAAGKEVVLLDAKGEPVGQPFVHPSTVADLAFNPPGKRFAAAHYGGVSLWWSQTAERKPKLLSWKGSHIAVSWSPDGAYVMTATQENDLHGWRMSDGGDIRMSGYPTKVRSWAWSPKPPFLATAGADQIICWPFAGSGPSGKPPVEFGGRGGGWGGADGDNLVARVAAHPKGDWIAAGFQTGEATYGRISERRMSLLIEGTGARVSALAWSPDGSWIAAGDEGGNLHMASADGSR
jgi:WD40 repeat protein